MARPREFDEAKVLASARQLFASNGYHGTSIDDLLQATGLLRGSLYKAFGSKRNLFEKILAEIADDFKATPESLDLLTVALKDLAAVDKPIRLLCLKIVGKNSKTYANLLGANLLAKMKENK